MKTFPELVADEIAKARFNHPKLNSLHEGFAVLLEEMDELKAEVWKKTRERERLRLLSEAVQIAAMAQRLAEGRLLLEHSPSGEYA